MAASSKKSLALDTNLLLDLAGEKDSAHEFKEEFSSRGNASELEREHFPGAGSSRGWVA